MDTSPIRSTRPPPPPSITSFNLPLDAPPLSTAILDVRAPTYGFAVDTNIQSIAARILDMFTILSPVLKTIWHRVGTQQIWLNVS